MQKDQSKEEKLRQIFMPQYLRRIEDVRVKEKRMVHYTSAANAVNILRSKEFWLRSVRIMDDFSEVRYGIALFDNFAKSERFKAFQNAFGMHRGVFSEAIEECVESFDKWTNKTYICCLSEHTKQDLPAGRFSMWHGYAKDNGVAFVFKPDSFINSVGYSRVYTSPVEYFDQNLFNVVATEIQANVERERCFLEDIDQKELKSRIINMIQAAVVSIKRPCFREEQEWRVIAMADHLSVLKRDAECISGIPQVVVKQPLTKEGENTDKGFSIAEDLEYIIIGPTLRPHIIADALVFELEKYGIKEPWKMIKTSGILPEA